MLWPDDLVLGAPILDDCILQRSGQFWPAKLVADKFWPTVLAEAAPTMERSLNDVRRSKSRPAKIEDLKFCLGRRLIATSTGLLGLAPAATQTGDLVVVLLGAPVPHILRKYEDHYTLVGECYVHGIMGGEALAHLNAELRKMGHRCRPFKDSMSEAPLESFLVR